MKPSNFQFPKGVKFASDDDLPKTPDKHSLLARIENADIQQGFVLQKTDNADYSHYAGINVSAQSIWAVFVALCDSLLPTIAAPIIGEMDNAENYFGPYANKQSILDTFAEFNYELSNDGFLQFGMICQVDNKTEEVFVEPSKHFKVWTNDKESFCSVMTSYGIPERTELSFIDEFPRTTHAEYPGTNLRYSDIIKTLIDRFGKLMTG